MASLEGNLDDTRLSLARAVETLEPEIQNGTLSEIDLSRCRYLGPLVVAYLSSVVQILRHRGVSPAVRLPTEPPGLQAFCSYSGLASLVGQGPPPETNHPRSETVPLTRTRSTWEAKQPVIDLIIRHTGAVSPDFEETLGSCIAEVFQNIDDHASSPVGGWYSARYMSRSGQTRVAVVDRGRGIHATLANRYPEIRDAKTALQRVIAGGVSAASTRRNSGRGISNVVVHVIRLRGRAVIISEDAWAELGPDRRWSYGRTRTRFEGTAFFFSLPVRAPVI